MNHATLAPEGWALRAADKILDSTSGLYGLPWTADDLARGRVVLAQVMVWERLLGRTRPYPGPIWMYPKARAHNLCEECGLTYRDHPLDPDNPSLTLVCDARPVLLESDDP